MSDHSHKDKDNPCSRCAVVHSRIVAVPLSAGKAEKRLRFGNGAAVLNPADFQGLQYARFPLGFPVV